jgi:S1-C subfamily serine protease
MLIDSHIWKMAEAHQEGTMPAAEVAALETRLATDVAFAAQFQECVNMLRALRGNGSQKRFAAMLKDIHSTEVSPKIEVRTIPLRSHYWRTAAVAAGIAVLTSLTTFWAIQHNNKKIASQYSLLRRDLESYKRSHNQLVTNINEERRQMPQAEANFSGTGFAVTNNGYLVTNYHVTEGADSIYIQNNEGKYFKAFVVSFDQHADVALLKVEDNKFRFGKSEVPYSFANGKKGLGEKIFTIGYPQDELVYKEGYISAKNGFAGDSMQYRLEMPASPGQSGSPVLDANGNVIAIVTGKESETPSTTFAVSSKAVVQLVQNLTKENNVHINKTNKLGKLNRQQQIEKMQLYTCSVKVYKR